MAQLPAQHPWAEHCYNNYSVVYWVVAYLRDFQVTASLLFRTSVRSVFSSVLLSTYGTTSRFIPMGRPFLQ